MTSNVIEIVLRLKDQASAGLAGVRQRLSGFKLAVGGIGAGIALTALVRNITEAERATLKLDVAYRNMGAGLGLTRKRLDEIATSLQRTTTASSGAIKEAAAVLLNFDRVSGDTFERTIRVANDMSVALGEDVVSSTQKLGRALQDPASAFGTLARSGVKLSDDLELVIKRLAETGRVAEAQDILLGEIERRFTGVGRAARDTLGGALTGLKNQVSDLFEGDASGFGGAVAQINGLTEALTKPEVKAGFDTLIAGLAKATEWAIKFATEIGEGAKAAGEFFAKLRTGANLGTEPIEIEFSRLANLRAQRQAIINGETVKAGLGSTVKAGERIEIIADTSKAVARVRDLDAQIEATRKRITALQVENSRGSTYNPTATSGKPAEPAKAANAANAALIAQLQAEALAAKAAEATQKLLDLRGEVLTGVAGAVEAWRQSEARIETALAAGAITAGEARESLAALQAEVRAAVLPEHLIEGEALATQIRLVEAALKAGKVSAEEAAQAIAALRREAAAEIGPAWLKAAEAWGALEARITAAAQAGTLTAAEARAALDELTRDNLEDIEVTVKKITVPEAPLSEFARSMQEHIQRTFADAFMSIGSDSGRDVARNFLDGFKRILAESAAHDLAKALGLHRLGAGGGSALGGLIDRVRGRGGGGGAEASAAGSAGGGPACAAQCASSVVAQVTSTVSETVKGPLAAIGETMKALGGGLWKFLTGTLSKLWEFIKAALGAIRAMVSASSAGSGGSGGFVGAIVQGIGALFGASAGGGALPAGRPRWVGEEGPELIVPGGGLMAYNQRQLAYAGGGAATLEYKPTYNVTIQGARDDRAMFGQLAAYIERQDQKSKAEIMDMLRRNGFGRMTR